MPPNISVGIVDDHPLVRESLAAAIERADGISLIAVSANGSEALTMLEKAKLDVLLLDLHMPGLSGLDVLAEMRRRNDDTKVIILTISGSDDEVQHAIDFGISGYLLKGARSSEIVEAINSVAAGASAFELGVAQKMSSTDAGAEHSD